MTRTMSLATSAAMPFDEVMGVFDQPAVDALLEAAVATAFRGSEVAIDVHASDLERFAHRSARLSLEWHLTDKSRVDRRGVASLQLFVLQSGSEPITELVLTLAVEDEHAHAVAGLLHDFLDELSDRLLLATA